MNLKLLFALAACWVVGIAVLLTSTEESEESGAVGVPAEWYEQGTSYREHEREGTMENLPDYTISEVTGEVDAVVLAYASLKKSQQGEYLESLRLSIASTAFMFFDRRRNDERDYFQALTIMNRTIVDLDNPLFAQAHEELWHDDEARADLKQIIYELGPPKYELPFETADSITTRFEAMDKDSLWTVVVDQLFDYKKVEN